MLEKFGLRRGTMTAMADGEGTVARKSQRKSSSQLFGWLAGAGLWNAMRVWAWTSTWTCAALLDAVFDYPTPLQSHAPERQRNGCVRHPPLLQLRKPAVVETSLAGLSCSLVWKRKQVRIAMLQHSKTNPYEASPE